MKTTRLTDRLTVSEQLEPADFPTLAAAGVTLVINDRPDDEAPDHLPSAAASVLAAENGMDYLYIPVTYATLSDEAIDRFGAALVNAVGPVHAHCRTGARSATLWALGQIRDGVPRDELRDALRAQGIDLKEGLAWLDRQA